MEALSLDRLDEYVEPNLPPELLLDPYNPANDQYFKTKTSLERRIVGHSATMRPKQVRAVKLRYLGKSNTEIAEVIKVTPHTVGRYVNTQAAQRLVSLMNHYARHCDGPNEDHRKSFLWRIAVDNQSDKPTVSISAITEINRMAGTYDKSAAAGTGNITVVVNNNVLQRGALDN